MAVYDTFSYTQSVRRKIPGFVRGIQWLLYFAVAIFAVIGAMYGALWLIPALGTLFGSWYYMGTARVTYVYTLKGANLAVQRVSGLASRPKKVDFGVFDLTTLRVMAPDGNAALDQAEEETRNAPEKRVTYDVSAHDADKICSVMYLTGIDREKGRPVKVYFQPSPELRGYIRQIAPGRVLGYDEGI